MNANQAIFPVSSMARVLGVSKAGFYAWLRRPALDQAQADAALLKRVRTVHATSHETYGAPRVHAEASRRPEYIRNARSMFLVVSHDVDSS